MTTTLTLISGHMLPIFFVYGLSFFSLGLTILVHNTSNSSLELRRFIWLFAAFGFIHGMGEWADMFLTLGTTYWSQSGYAIIGVVGFFLSLASFVLLLDFGVQAAWLRSPGVAKARQVSGFVAASLVVFVIVYGILAPDKNTWVVNSNVLMRYWLATPAALLAAIGFYRKSTFDDLRSLDGGKIRKCMVGMSVCLVVYAILAGLIVPKAAYLPASVLNYETFTATVGVPVQLFRAACALCAAFLIGPIMSVFTAESSRTLEQALVEARQASENLEVKVNERTVELARANEELTRQIEERIQLETKAKEARIAADEANRAKSDFLANMSHEIRTPLNGVIGMIDLCLATTLTPVQRGDLETAKNSADSLLTVINDILDFSKIEARKLHLDLHEFELRETVESTVATLGLRAEQKGVELICGISSDVPPYVVGDVGRLRQILVNLIGNAIKFTEHGEIAVNVKPESAGGMESLLHFSITDTGIGIPKEKQTSIFEAFRQLDNSTTRIYGGTGLGLAICSQLVQLMGGRIWVESELGKGSVFHFTAKFGVPKSVVVRPALRTLINLQGLPVLVVDDNSTNRRILEEMLTNWHMNPAATESGRAALDRMVLARKQGKPFPLVIVDRNMPGMDGFAVVEKIRRDPTLAGASIMMLSSASGEHDYQRCRDLGVTAYLTKPVQQSALLNAIVDSMEVVTPKQTAEPLSEAGPVSDLQHLHVLLAEDNPVNQRVAVRLLEKHNCSVDVVKTGLEVLAATKTADYDIILMDLQMPQMDGLKTTAAIRDEERDTGRHLPILAVTAHAMKGDKERCLAGGMDGYIAKPISAPELYAEIDRLTAQRREPKAAQAATAPAFDEALLRRRVDNDDQLLRELVEIFQANYASMLGSIAQAITDADPRSLETAAHTLRGSLSTFAANKALVLAARLETMGREQQLREAHPTFRQLEKEITRLHSALVAFTERTPA